MEKAITYICIMNLVESNVKNVDSSFYIQKHKKILPYQWEKQIILKLLPTPVIKDYLQKNIFSSQSDTSQCNIKLP